MLRRTIALLCLLFTCPFLAGQALVHLTFDDPDNLAKDQSGRGNDGNAQGTLTAAQNGRAGGAVQLNGDSAIALGVDAAQTLGGSYTISLWVRTTQETGAAGAAELGAGLVVIPGLEENEVPVALTGDRAGFGHGQSTIHSQSPINQGEWTNVVVTRDRDTGVSSLFVNGRLEAQRNGPSVAAAIHELLLLGGNPGQGLPFAGELDDFQLYDRAIPASDVAFLHANPGSALFQAVPEPSTNTLLVSGLVVAFSLAWRQRRRSAAAARPQAAQPPARHASRQASLSHGSRAPMPHPGDHP